MCCCDQDTIDQGRYQLIIAFSKVRYAFEAAGIKHHGKDSAGCMTVNGYAFNQLSSPSPTCWTCILEHRQTEHWWVPFPVPGRLTDHWVVVCQSHPKRGSYQEISFDYWANRPAGESPDVWFRKHYDQPLGGMKGGSLDCAGNITPGREGAFMFPYSNK